MKTLLIMPKYPFGGAERQLFELAKYGIENEEDVTVLDVESDTDRVVDGVNIKGLNKKILLKEFGKPLRIFIRIMTLIEIGRFVKKGKFDNVVFFFKLFLPLVFILKDTKLIYSVREFERKYFSGFYKMLIKKTNIVMTNNFPSFVYLTGFHKNAHFVENIADFRDTAIEKKKPADKTYLIVSNIVRHKNILPAVKVFAGLENKGYELNIAGRIAEEAYYNEIVKSIGSHKNIKMLGNLSQAELNEEYQSCCGLIHLSLQEGMPNAILDAIKYDKPFIALKTVENIAFLDNNDVFMIAHENELKSKIIELNDKDNKGLIHAELIKAKERLKERLSKERNGKIFYNMLKNR